MLSEVGRLGDGVGGGSGSGSGLAGASAFWGGTDETQAIRVDRGGGGIGGEGAGGVGDGSGEGGALSRCVGSGGVCGRRAVGRLAGQQMVLGVVSEVG